MIFFVHKQGPPNMVFSMLIRSKLAELGLIEEDGKAKSIGLAIYQIELDIEKEK